MNEHYCVFSIFGATGDLTKRKLLTAFYSLEVEKKLKDRFRILGIARKEKTDEEYRKEAADAIRKFSRVKVKEDILKKLISRIHYKRVDIKNYNDYLDLRALIEKISGGKCNSCERLFYLAIHYRFFGIIVNNLKKARIASRHEQGKTYCRVVFEKPFGHDFKSAKNLNKVITKVFDEKQIFRIDHYLAKELVQNLIVLRFANSIFEPLWNKEYIDHIQITVAEALGVEARGDYYDKAGAVRDVMQNHMMQLLTLVGMEAPKSISADHISDEKVKVLKSISKLNKKNIKKIALIGQYAKGTVKGKNIVGYRDEPEVSKNSKTETYVALKLEINNKLWKGVPFYLRTGKRLQERATEIVIVYKDIPYKLFSHSKPDKNMMVIRVQPYEGITLQFNAKVPGSKVVIDNVEMDFCHECKFGPNTPAAYERLLYDVMMGDPTLFTRWDEVEHSWKVVEPLLEGLKSLKLAKYKAGSWGPEEADKLMEHEGHKWVSPKRPSYADLLDK